MDKVSIIVPVYNVEKYINRCIESILNQTYENLEIILVDDASTDNCPLLCDRWSEKDKRIKVIHKSINEGLGEARNTGLYNSTGKYIFFWDSDDYVSRDIVSKCCLNALLFNSDLVCYGYKFISKDNIEKDEIPIMRKRVYEREEIINEVLPNMIASDCGNKIFISAWSMMFNRKILIDNNWKYISERKIISEDVYSHLSLFPLINTLSIISDTLYYYCENSSSLTHTYKKDRFNKIKEFYFESTKLSKRMGYSDNIIDRIGVPFVDFTIATLKQEVVQSNYRMLREIVNDYEVQSNIKKVIRFYSSLQKRIFLLLLRFKIYPLIYLVLLIRK